MISNGEIEEIFSAVDDPAFHLVVFHLVVVFLLIRMVSHSVVSQLDVSLLVLIQQEPENSLSNCFLLQRCSFVVLLCYFHGYDWDFSFPHCCHHWVCLHCYGSELD